MITMRMMRMMMMMLMMLNVSLALHTRHRTQQAASKQATERARKSSSLSYVLFLLVYYRIIGRSASRASSLLYFSLCV
uniref:Secreted protein n=1 Tax=Anopheles darlingi TaxID=43151 RepID=A0A2M4DD67_ANODA